MYKVLNALLICDINLHTFINRCLQKSDKKKDGMITFILLVTAIELNFTQMTLGTLRTAGFVVVIWQA